MAKILGIDFGISNSCMAVMDRGKPIVVENVEGSRKTPSVVAFTETGEVLVGEAARHQSCLNSKGTFFGIGRLLGLAFDEFSPHWQDWAAQVVEGPNGSAGIADRSGNFHSPEEVTAYILAKLKADAEAKLCEKITQAVITAPALASLAYLNALKNAGDIAGLEVLRIYSHPVAASVAYGFDKKKDEEIVVYDLGGGTFDISVLEIGDGVFEVKATNGDTQLGGDDWDNRIMEWVIFGFMQEEGIDLSKQPDAVQRIKGEAEKAKVALSSSSHFDINLPFITADQSGPKHITKTLTRANLEQLTDGLFERTLGPVRRCLKDAGISEQNIAEFVLVGGMTRIPKVIDSVRHFAGKPPFRNVNPDEVVAMGAAIMGGTLKGDVKDILLLDVTPLTLGIETVGGVTTPMIPHNTTIPTRKSQIFSTDRDQQTFFDVVVLRGEEPMSCDNKCVAAFKLDGIAAGPRGVPQIEVTFDIDATGMLHVSAKDLGTGKERRISVTGSNDCSREEIERMQKGMQGCRPNS